MLSHFDINDVKEHVAKVKSDLFLLIFSSKLSLMASLSYSLEWSREMQFRFFWGGVGYEFFVANKISYV